jgi:hypothetical protein
MRPREQEETAAAGPSVGRCNMLLIELVLTICVLDKPSSCREEHLQFEDAGSTVTCMMQAPPQIAKWSAEHPNLRVVKWRCEYPSKNKDI